MSGLYRGCADTCHANLGMWSSILHFRMYQTYTSIRERERHECFMSRWNGDTRIIETIVVFLCVVLDRLPDGTHCEW